MKLILSFILISFLMPSVFANSLKGNFQLKDSKISYVVKYLIKRAEGESVGAKGKGQCTDVKCDFIVGAPIKSFESKDSNRDLNMLKTTKADKFPLVSARMMTTGEVKDGKILVDLEIDFGGVKKLYSKIPFTYIADATGFSTEGSFDLLLDGHNIEKPSLLGVDIESIVPIRITAHWIQM